MNKKFKLFGDRVLMERVSFKQGMIITPEQDNAIARIGRVVAHGDGSSRDTRKATTMHVKVGDLVYFQTNAQMAAMSAYARGEEDMLINIPQCEIVATVSSNAQSLDGFQVIGDWVLVKPFVRENEDTRIVVPDTAKASMSLYFRVEQKGSTVDVEVEPGQEVLIAQGYCNPIQIKGQDYGFILKQFIHGIIEENCIIA